MIQPAEKTAAYRAMGKSVPESDVDRLAEAVRAQAARQGDPAGDGADFAGTAHAGTGVAAAAPFPTPRDVMLIALYLGLGVFTRIWTDLIVGFDFEGNVGLFSFALAVVLVLHGVIFTAVLGAWRANWILRRRNFVAMAALIGYIATQLATAL